jgi:hypothetical protein
MLYRKIFIQINLEKNRSIGIQIGVSIRRSAEKISQCTGGMRELIIHSRCCLFKICWKNNKVQTYLISKIVRTLPVHHTHIVYFQCVHNNCAFFEECQPKGVRVDCTKWVHVTYTKTPTPRHPPFYKPDALCATHQRCTKAYPAPSFFKKKLKHIILYTCLVSWISKQIRTICKKLSASRLKPLHRYQKAPGGWQIILTYRSWVFFFIIEDN